MKILASDFDGTLFVSDDKVFKNNIKMINEFRSKNNLFIIITGRGIESIKKEIIKNDIKYDYLICENGAMIFDDKDNILDSTYLDKKDVLEIIKIIEEENLKYIFDTGINYLNNMDMDLSKLACIYIDKTSTKDFIKTKNKVDENTNTYNYISPNWINIVNKKVNKLVSLKKLLKIINQEDNIYTIGDAINDIDMIKEFSGAIMKVHESVLDNLSNKQYSTVSDYIKELI